MDDVAGFSCDFSYRQNRVSMSKIFLNAYDPDNHNQGYKKWPVYALNIDSNTVDIIYFDSYQDTKSLPQAGMGDFRKIGALGRKK